MLKTMTEKEFISAVRLSKYSSRFSLEGLKALWKHLNSEEKITDMQIIFNVDEMVSEFIEYRSLEELNKNEFTNFKSLADAHQLNAIIIPLKEGIIVGSLKQWIKRLNIET